VIAVNRSLASKMVSWNRQLACGIAAAPLFQDFAANRLAESRPHRDQSPGAKTAILSQLRLHAGLPADASQRVRTASELRPGSGCSQSHGGWEMKGQA